MKQNLELKNANALHATSNDGLEEQSPDRQKEIKVKVVGQMKIPVYQKFHFWSPDFVKCDGQIIKYDMRALGIWRALVSCSHTILTDWETWYHMGLLVLVGFVTAVVVIFAGLDKTLGEASPVTNRISLMISFILSAYITITVNRWDRIRNGTLGALWGALENVNMVTQRILLSNTAPTNSPTSGNSGSGRSAATLEAKNLLSGEELTLAEEMIRLSRLTLFLTFKAVQDLGERDQLITLLNQQLVTEEERQWLLSATPGTRPLMVVTWMEGYIGMLRAKGYTVPRYLDGLAGVQLNGVRGGIGATLGAIGAQLPYPYVHIVYWTVQLLLAITAIQYGCNIGVEWYAKTNGNGQYSPDTGNWPQHPTQWWTGQIFVNLAGFTIYALFCEGIMNICAKISNPMNLSDIAFSEKVYAAFMYNNCKALRAGLYSYHHLNQPALMGPAVRPGAARSGGKPGGGAGGGAGVAGGKAGQGQAKEAEAPAVDAGSGEATVMGTSSEHAEGAIINLVVAMTS